MKLTKEDLVVSQEAFDKFVNTQIEFAKITLADKPTSVAPHLVVETVDENGKHSITIAAIMADFNEHEDKKAILMGLGRKVYEERQLPIMACLMSEAWMATNPPPGVPPSKCDTKREIIVIMAMDVSKTYNRTVSIPVNRIDGNRIEVAEEQIPVSNDGVMYLLHHFFRGFASACVEH